MGRVSKAFVYVKHPAHSRCFVGACWDGFAIPPPASGPGLRAEHCEAPLTCHLVPSDPGGS